MKYLSTRDTSIRISAKQAILQGISADGGLFVPESIPKLSHADLTRLAQCDYCTRAVEVLGLYLTDYTAEQLTQSVTAAYGGSGFAIPGSPAQLAQIAPDTYMLELWHGPTGAFKDMALQLLPHLLGHAMRDVGGGRTVVILVATSGDTGKAALEGFCDVPGTRIIVFYPDEGVSAIQKLQMITQQGGNVGVAAVSGNFDDCQTGVKQLFSDGELAELLAGHNMVLSSANSINWGRLVPQIVYYVSAYCDLLAEGELECGQPLDIAVPTGNFGNILAAWYARQMGVPIGKLICASNKNNVLAEFINTGCYNSRREFYVTSSPSMDILISSNLERLLFELAGRDAAQVRGWMAELKAGGSYSITAEQLDVLRSNFYGGWCDDAVAAGVIRSVFEGCGYLCDTHTAVALDVQRQYAAQGGGTGKTLVVSTATPHKFAADVLAALGQGPDGDDFAQLAQLEAVSGLAVPPQFLALKDAPPRFTGAVDRGDMRAAVLELLKI